MVLRNLKTLESNVKKTHGVQKLASILQSFSITNFLMLSRQNKAGWPGWGWCFRWNF